jgi:hypothetical protein
MEKMPHSWTCHLRLGISQDQSSRELLGIVPFSSDFVEGEESNARNIFSIVFRWQMCKRDLCALQLRFLTLINFFRYSTWQKESILSERRV